MSLHLNSKKYLDLQAYKNIWNQNQYFIDLFSLALTSFQYKDMPTSIDTRFLELSMILTGRAVIYYDSAMNKLLGLQCVTNGQLNQYGYPVTYRAYGVNGFRSGVLDETNSVIFYNNEMHTPDLFRLNYASDLLAKIDETIDINLNGLKTPLLFQGTQKQLESLKNLYRQYMSGSTELFVDSSTDVTGNAINTVDLKPSYYVDKLQEAKANVWNDTMTYLGITNMTVFKKERQTDDEVRRLLGGAYAYRNKRLKPREDSVRKLNELFGLNVSVDFNENQDIKTNYEN